ncbi:MAG: AraC family transcriptional regulator [Eubacteriales bacterium]
MTYISTPLHKEFNITEIVTVHYFEYTRDYVFHGESHDFWEFLYIDKGDVIVTTDDIGHLLTGGDVIFHRPNEFHAVKSTGTEAINLIAISFICDSSAMEFFQNKIYSLSIAERSIISKIITEASSAFLTPLHIPFVEQVIASDASPFGSEQLISIYLELFLITLRRNNTPEIAPSIHDASTTISPNKQLFEQILEYMQYHLSEKLTISSICENFNISRSTLELLFHKEKQCGAIEYFNTRKLNRAKELIRDGSMTLTEISFHLSYSSLQYFSKQFKKATGMSPLAYSNSIKGMSKAVEESSTPRGVVTIQP